jgi:hypothetical protein
MLLQDTVFREGKTETKSLLPQQVQKTEPLISKAPAEIRLFELDGGDGLFGDELMGTGRISITRKVKKRGPRAASECAFT